MLLAPLAIRRDRWDEPRFRFLFLCSLLLYVVLFNHQAERASFVIAMAGTAMWVAGSPARPWRTALTGLAFVTVTLMSAVVPVAQWMRSPSALLWRLAVPTLAVWLTIQWELFGGFVTRRRVGGSLSGEGIPLR